MVAYKIHTLEVVVQFHSVQIRRDRAVEARESHDLEVDSSSLSHAQEGVKPFSYKG